MQKNVFLSIGSNIEPRLDYLQKAIEHINNKIGRILKKSHVYESEPWGFKTDNLFLNMAIEVETQLSPIELLKTINEIETLMGRTPEQKGVYRDRIIDIDILFYGNERINTQELVIPHLRLHNRNFCLLPMCDIAPNFEHPELQKTMKFLLEHCDDKRKAYLYKFNKDLEADIK